MKGRGLKVRILNLLEPVRVDEELTIKAHYAGHVIGAVMVEVCRPCLPCLPCLSLRRVHR